MVYNKKEIDKELLKIFESKEWKTLGLFLDIDTVSKILKVSAKTVSRRIKNKEIPALKLGNKYTILKCALEIYMRNSIV